MRYFLVLITGMFVSMFLLQSQTQVSNDVVPSFLKIDAVAVEHQTTINLFVHSKYKPNDAQLEFFKQDYSKLWAHLNHLFETNDVEAGKEYYTEAWFKQINHHYQGVLQGNLKRIDLSHELHIDNWSSDNLVCTVTDSNAVFQYQLSGKIIRTTKVQLQMVLLFQGDHWRIDAIKYLGEDAI